ncbi:unnamed protein product [Paramecium sonneborni]|uniref:Uncharacterized protein n=1 Tax=Paramecium sonneborni TaxID=65129 RepID=A0A8S1RP18_9CILI|nr:unnamed protein product [Paramecium sonneborni]
MEIKNQQKIILNLLRIQIYRLTKGINVAAERNMYLVFSDIIQYRGLFDILGKRNISLIQSGLERVLKMFCAMAEKPKLKILLRLN